MEITLVIVTGIVVLTVVTMVGDYFTKTRVAKASQPQGLEALEHRVRALESRLVEQDAKVAQLEGEVAFTNKLLEQKNTP